MKNLEEENKELKATVDELVSRNEVLKKELKWRNFELAKTKADYNIACAKPGTRIHKIDPNQLSFVENAGRRAYLLIDDVKVFFASPNDKAAMLAKAICKPSRVKKFAKGPVGIDDIYAWYTGKDDWYDDDLEDEKRKKERKKFKKDLYQWFRRINNKAAVKFNGENIFIRIDNQYCLNPMFTPRIPKAKH